MVAFFQLQAAATCPARRIRVEMSGASRVGPDFLRPLNPQRTGDFPAIPDDDVGIRARHAAPGELRQTPGLGGSRGLSSFTLDPHGDNRIAANPAPIVLPDCWRPWHRNTHLPYLATPKLKDITRIGQSATTKTTAAD